MSRWHEILDQAYGLGLDGRPISALEALGVEWASDWDECVDAYQRGCMARAEEAGAVTPEDLAILERAGVLEIVAKCGTRVEYRIRRGAECLFR